MHPGDSNSEGGSIWDSRNSTLGPAVKILLAKSGTTYPEPTAEDRKRECLDNPAEHAAELLANGQLIGWYQGREEFGSPVIATG